MISAYPHAAKANQYARDVVSGKIIACRWVRLACQRHLDDLDAAKAKDYPFRFDEERVERVCEFAELLPHVKGEWARGIAGDPESKLIRLQPWQCWVLASIFGWVNKKTGLRRFAEAYIEIPRKNGKSVLAAVIGLYMLVADGEEGAEIYCGATKLDQALEVFTPAWRMAARAPDFIDDFGVELPKQSILVPTRGGKFEPVVGKPGDGASPSCAIVDEYHEHQTDELVATMRSGMGARRQPLLLEITTAGDNLAGPCKAAHDEAKEILQGHRKAEHVFCVIWTIDEDDNWRTIRAQKKANPNYGVSIYPDYLKRELEDAKSSARKQNVYKTKHLNVWVSALGAWFNMELWRELRMDGLNREDFKGCKRWVGIDLASKWDLSAIVDLFVRDEAMEVDGELVPGPHFFVFGRYYIPSARVEEPENEHYQRWVKEARLIATDGEVTDYDRIERDILEDAKDFQALEYVYDKFNANQLVSHLLDHGLVMVEADQSTKRMSPAMKEVEALARAKRLHHDGDPVFEWMMSNVMAREDANGNIHPRKPTDRRKKIDGPVALFNAISRSMLYEPPKTPLLNELTAADLIL